ncbi:hypothetical protein DC31_06285 [Microbacterium sp. CH12i]|uniref:hypothetical protein n=1 Tax=Microbacterium sp. CH12i TaxID=1479651 RepID=UPI0004612FFF|nr:hypothetical protein [Microbacterium sp. CH12i]KDA04568.1 hypothetical protein DC31_06285 [Microbacterium sp. CH12i]
MTRGIRQHQERLARFRAKLESEGGWASTVVLILGTIFLVLGGLQVALWFNAVNVAQAAVQSGYSVARAYESNADAGKSTALQLIAGIPLSLRDPSVSINRTADTVTVTVTGNATAVLPGIELLLQPVTYTHTGPVERWVPAP